MDTYQHYFSATITQSNHTIQGVIFTTYANSGLTDETVLQHWPALWSQSVSGDFVRPESHVSGQYHFLYPLTLQNFEKVQVDILCTEPYVQIEELKRAARTFLDNIADFAELIRPELRPYWHEAPVQSSVEPTQSNITAESIMRLIIFGLVLYILSQCFPSNLQNQSIFRLTSPTPSLFNLQP